MVKLATLKVTEWLPDQAPYENPGSPSVANVQWVNSSYEPALQFESLGFATSARVQGAIACEDTNGDIHVYLGTGTNLYEYTSTGFTSLASGFTATDGEYWRFAVFSSPSYTNKVIATDFADTIQWMDLGGAAFVALTASTGTTPKAQYVATNAAGAFVMVGHTEESVRGLVPHRVQWCGIGNPTYWGFQTLNDANAQAGEQFLNAEFGQITGIVGIGQDFIIFQEKAITRAYYVGGGAIFSFQTFERERGNIYPNSIVQLGNMTYFIAQDGFCVTDGATVTQIGHGKVDSTWLADVSQQYTDRVRGALDPINKLIKWGYCSSGNTTGIPDKIICYNYMEDKWSQITQAAGASLSILFTSRSIGYTMEQLDTVNTNLDLITPSLDDPYWQGGQQIIQAFDANNNIGTLTGNACDAMVDTTEWANPDGTLSYIDGARVICTSGAFTPSPGVTIYTRATEDAAYTSTVFSARNSRSGLNNGRTTGRYAKA